VIVASAWLWRRLRPRPAGPALLWLRLCGPRLSSIIRSQLRATEREVGRWAHRLGSELTLRAARLPASDPGPGRSLRRAQPQLSLLRWLRRQLRRLRLRLRLRPRLSGCGPAQHRQCKTSKRRVATLTALEQALTVAAAPQ
jgi:hypothetical protein